MAEPKSQLGEETVVKQLSWQCERMQERKDTHNKWELLTEGERYRLKIAKSKSQFESTAVRSVRKQPRLYIYDVLNNMTEKQKTENDRQSKEEMWKQWKQP